MIILLGGRTGRDGIGGATGSSKAHNTESIETCGAEVQKGNAPDERKTPAPVPPRRRLPPDQALQRLWRRRRLCGHRRAGRRPGHRPRRGAQEVRGPRWHRARHLRVPGAHGMCRGRRGRGGVHRAMPQRKTSRPPSSPRSPKSRACACAWNGVTIVDLSREFLNSNGAPKHQEAHVVARSVWQPSWEGTTLAERMTSLVTDLNVASNKGLAERFDSTIGAATVLMPFGGKTQLTPSEAMVAKFPVRRRRPPRHPPCPGASTPILMEADQLCRRLPRRRRERGQARGRRFRA